jgi:D-apiose dehydrogenase
LEKKRVALIGCGFIAPTHLAAWKKIPEAEVVALCDTNFAAAQSLARRYHIKQCYADYRQLFANEKLHAADIAAPADFHLPITVSAARKGIAVLLQKPMAGSLREAQKIVLACDTAKIPLMIHQNFRFQPFPQHIKAILQNGDLGEVFYCRIFHRVPALVEGPEGDAFVLRTQARLAKEAHLVLFNMAIHHLDTMRFLFGEPKQIFADLQHFSGRVKGEDHALITLNYAKMVCLIEESWVTRGPESIGFHLEGEKGVLKISDEKLEFWQANGAYRKTNLRKIAPNARLKSVDAWSFVKLQQEFLACLLNGKTPSTSGKDNLKTLELVFKGYKSAKLQKPIKI